MRDGGEQAASQPSPVDETDDKTASRNKGTLLDDIEDLVLDAKTYIDAELSYQKARASFVISRVKRIAFFGVVATVLALVSIIALSVGLILALTPWISAWGATVVVVGGMLATAYLLIRMAGTAWGEIMTAVREKEDGADDAQQ